MRMSCISLFCKLFSTFNQKFAPLFLEMYIPQTRMPLFVYDQYVINCTGNGTASFIHNFIINGIHLDNRIDVFQATETSRFYFWKYPIRDRTDCFGRHTLLRFSFIQSLISLCYYQGYKN